MNPAEEQDLIGKLLVHTPRPRAPFPDWWHCVDVELHALGCWSDSTWGETAWRYREHRAMTPKECAVAVLAERAAS